MKEEKIEHGKEKAMDKDNHDQTPIKGPDKASSSGPADLSSYSQGVKNGVRKLLSGIASPLYFEQGTTGGPGPRHGDVATQLAMDRNYMAAERTLMAWVRTALSMISFGFTIGKLGQVIRSVEVKAFLGRSTWISLESIAYFLVILGTMALLMATIQHRVRMHQLYSMGLRRQISTSSVVAVMLIVVGGFALSSLVLAL